ncbi:MAG TPA: hypothetical protein VK179_09760, partial [Bacteroidales bacterium]|nr:hypothetical protein [Bacteroidales bacterium]
EVEAYWLADSEGVIDHVYLFQHDEYICTATKIVAYNEATCEQSDEDREEYTKQAKYVSHFDKTIKDRKNKLNKIAIMPAETIDEIESIQVETVEHKSISNQEDDIEKLIEEYDPREYQDKAHYDF